MKFTCTKTNFNNGINIALKAVPGKTTMPILECVVIEAKGDMVKLTTNDMQLGIETKIPAEIEQDGIILVNAKMISEISGRSEAFRRSISRPSRSSARRGFRGRLQGRC